MDIKKVEELLAKYYDAATTEEEERILFTYFSKKNVPDHLQEDKEVILGLYYTAKENVVGAEGLEQSIMDAIRDYEKDKKEKNRFFIKRSFVRYAVAASVFVAILLGVKFKGELFRSPDKGSFDNPEMAYMETKKTLLLVSSLLNKGTEDLTLLTKLNEGMEELTALKKFEDGVGNLKAIHFFERGLSKAAPIKKFDEAQKLIMKKERSK